MNGADDQSTARPVSPFSTMVRTSELKDRKTDGRGNGSGPTLKSAAFILFVDSSTVWTSRAVPTCHSHFVHRLVPEEEGNEEEEEEEEQRNKMSAKLAVTGNPLPPTTMHRSMDRSDLWLYSTDLQFDSMQFKAME